MKIATLIVVLAVSLVLSASDTARAVDVSVSGHRLAIRAPVDRPTSRSVYFSSLDRDELRTGLVDLVHNGAFFQLLNPTTGKTETFALPAEHWTAESPTKLIYRDRRAESGPCTLAELLDGRRLKVRCRGKNSPINFVLDEPTQGSIVAFFQSGNVDWWALFGGKIKSDRPGTFEARDALAVAGADAPTTTTTSTTTSTSTTTTTTPDCSCAATLADVALTAGGSAIAHLTVSNTSARTCGLSWAVGQTQGTPTISGSPVGGTLTLNAGQSQAVPIAMTDSGIRANDAATMTATVGGDASCSARGSVCVVPTGENTASAGPGVLGSELATVEGWTMTLTPVTTDFQGRRVAEFDPGGGGPDTCGFNFTRVTNRPGQSWGVRASNGWGEDWVGYKAPGVALVRQPPDPPPPCGTSFSQQMAIDCPFGWVGYTTNGLGAGIDLATVSSERDGQTATIAR
jgi:hypothetical protein